MKKQKLRTIIWSLIALVIFLVILVVGVLATGKSRIFLDYQTKHIQQAQTNTRLCKTITGSSNLCSTGYLTHYFKDEKIAEQASAICYLESKGNADSQSYVDFCRDGNAYSFGLFQINVIAKADHIPACQGVFKTAVDEVTGDMACLKKQNDICIISDCRVIDLEKYQTCKEYITNAENNIKVAQAVYEKNKSWEDWGSYDFCKSRF